MKFKKVPQMYRSLVDNTITLTYQNHSKTLIWLHGLGDSSEGFLSFMTHSQSPLYQGTKIVLLQAPMRSVAIDQDLQMNSWYDIYTLNRFSGDQKQVFNFEHIQQSCKIIENHVQDEILFWKQKQPQSKINPVHRIFLGGFSQGGAISLCYGLQSKKILAGIIGMSSYLFRTIQLTNIRKLPVCLMHGERDEVVKQIEAKRTYQRLIRDSGPLCDYHLIPKIGHTACLSELKIINQFLNSNFQLIEKHYNKDK